ncbi:molecular chaperone Hsp90 [Gordonia jinhuaensis]|uniref:Molecular chaperone Hsp90 n=1 Tax=Gordonia jinhuaensis TaxID=1517702 RepID=A0A916WXM3_9ACTN|nr:hypothetical protein [Gordonia jinhuaensis]GGB37720.1 molecular chaperone Hsp90 [Gordonia jinhuaensis]
MLSSWSSSPTRLAEDAAVESDVVRIDYRDRLITELAANAADAAGEAGIAGELAVWLEGDRLHVANRGAPLTAAGVRALTAMRVSRKQSADARDRRTSFTPVGRFGLGFHAVATVADDVEIRSRAGGVEFSRDGTMRAVEGIGIGEIPPEGVPMLRLAWPVSTPPADGFDTEVILTLRADLNADALLGEISAQAADLLLELPVLQSISIAERYLMRRGVPLTVVGTRSGSTAGSDVAEQLSHAGLVILDGAPARDREWVALRGPVARWFVRGTPDHIRPVGPDVLRAPTRTDIELTLPARLVAELPLTPDRRMLDPEALRGSGALAAVAEGYAAALAELPADQRLSLVPQPGLAAGAVDEGLRGALLTELAGGRWLPGAAGTDLIASRAIVIADLTDKLAAVLGELFTDLAHPVVSESADLPRLRSLGVTEWGLADLVERLADVHRPPRWWGRLYDALAPLISDDRTAGELGALPVPRTDGRMHVGVRGLFSGDGVPASVSWVPMVHPDASSTLLDRLGIEHLDAQTLLGDASLRAAIDDERDGVDDHLDGDADLDSDVKADDVSDLAIAVLEVLAADDSARVPSWLGGLLLPAQEGGVEAADEMLLPGGPLAAVLVDDAPFATVRRDIVDRFGVGVLRRLGAGWGFSLVHEEYPTAPDHDLPDESSWWDSRPEPPTEMVAVRDLDLVADDSWPAALTMLAEDPVIADTLADRNGYTAWWLRHFATVTDAEGTARRLGEFRAPSDEALAGVYEVLDHPAADALSGALARASATDAAQAADLLDRLGDPSRDIDAGTAALVHGELVDAFVEGAFGLDQLAPPATVRTLAGTTTADGIVADRPWYLHVVDPARLVVVTGGSGEPHQRARRLAELLDLPTASEAIDARVLGVGRPYRRTGSLAVRAMLSYPVGEVGPVVHVHDVLEVQVNEREGSGERDAVIVAVPWWVDGNAELHITADS